MRNSTKQNKSVAKVAAKRTVTTSRKQVKPVAKLTKEVKPVAKASKPAKTVKPAAKVTKTVAKVTKKATPVAKQVKKMTVVSSRTRRTENKSVLNKIVSLRDKRKMSYPEIAAELNKSGVKSTTGKLFTNRRVRYQYDTAK
jgi:hypothetical protein